MPTRRELETFDKPPYCWTGNAHFVYDPRSLRNVILTNPLRPEDVEGVLSRSEIKWSSWSSCWTDDKPLHWVITLKKDGSDLAVALLHEVAHAYYRGGAGWKARTHADGTKTDAGLIEDIIEGEAQRFYAVHRDFVDGIVERLRRTSQETNIS